MAEWQDEALCKGMVTDPNDDGWFDKYEKDPYTAREVDEFCQRCPVQRICFWYGIESGQEYGVWGGVYIKSGRVDVHHNRHKTDETWDTLEDLLRYDFSKFKGGL